MLDRAIDKSKLEPYYTNLKMIDLKQGHAEHPDDVEIYEKQYDTIQDQTHDMENFKQLCEEHNINTILKDMTPWKDAFTSQNMAKTLASIVKSLNLDK